MEFEIWAAEWASSGAGVPSGVEGSHLVLSYVCERIELGADLIADVVRAHNLLNGVLPLDHGVVRSMGRQS